MTDKNEYQLAIEAIQQATSSFPVDFEIFYSRKTNDWHVKVKQYKFQNREFLDAVRMALKHVIQQYEK